MSKKPNHAAAVQSMLEPESTAKPLAVPGISGPLVAPAFLDQYAEEGSTESAAYVGRFPFLKIVQSTSARELKDEHGEGAVIYGNEGTLVAPRGKPFIFIPLLFYPTWEKRSDVNDTNSPVIVEQYFTPQNPIVHRCKSRDLREEPYGNGLVYKYSEVLNFAVLIDAVADGGDQRAAGQFAILSMLRGGYYQGQKLNYRIARERLTSSGKPAPIYCNRFAAETFDDQSMAKPFWNLRFSDPEAPFITDPDRVAVLRQAHMDLVKLHAANALASVYSPEKANEN